MGFAFGAVATSNGLGLGQTGLMSLIVFAGASQFIAVGMLAGGAGAVSVVATTFLVNLRHLLMSASIAEKTSELSDRLLPLFSFGVTDETFALNSAVDRHPIHYLGVNTGAYIGWVAGSVAGGLAGGLKYDFSALDFVIPATFICLLVLVVSSWRHVAVAMVSGAVILVVIPVLGVGTGVAVATITGAGLGMMLEEKGGRGS